MNVDEVRTGIPLLDHQHQKYLNAVEKLQHLCYEGEPDADAMRDLLDEITNYAVDNFDTEEQVMQVENYPHFNIHKDKHDLFKEKIDGYGAELAAGAELASLAERMTHVLVNWFVNQIKDDDMKLADFLRNRGAGG